jgi:hypothetical protein
MKLSDFQNTLLFFSTSFSISSTWIRIGLSSLIFFELMISVVFFQTKTDYCAIYNLMIIVLVIFLAMSVVFLFLNVKNCGCFGTVFKTNPVVTIAKNILLIGLILLQKKREHKIYAN